MISSIGYNEQEIIQNILSLHCGGGPIECDPTYSVGNFYKHGLKEPMFRYDIDPQRDGVVGASVDSLPLENESVRVVMFDPPFLMNGESKKKREDKTGLIGKRFTSFANWKELTEMYGGAMKELYRVLKNRGVLIFKCQDSVVGGKNYFSHVWIANRAVEIGFYPKDLLILLARSRMTDGRKQQHARKFHSYFWVLEKRTIGYKLVPKEQP